MYQIRRASLHLDLHSVRTMCIIKQTAGGRSIGVSGSIGGGAGCASLWPDASTTAGEEQTQTSRRKSEYQVEMRVMPHRYAQHQRSARSAHIVVDQSRARAIA